MLFLHLYFKVSLKIFYCSVTEEPGRLQSMGSLRVGHDWATSLSLFAFMHWRRKWQPTPVFLPGESQGEPGGLPSLGSHRVGHDWSDLAAGAAPPLGKPTCRVHQVKCRAGWITSWNQDCQEKYQQPHICRWYCPNGKKCRVTKKLLDKCERAEWKSWHVIKHSKN